MYERIHHQMVKKRNGEGRPLMNTYQDEYIDEESRKKIIDFAIFNQ